METIKLETTSMAFPAIVNELCDVTTRIVGVLRCVKSDINIARLADTATWADLHLDSLDLIAALVELENEFDLPPDAIDFQAIGTFGDLKWLLKNHLKVEKQAVTNEIDADFPASDGAASKEIADLIEHLRNGTALPFIAGHKFSNVREKAALYQAVREWMETRGTTWYGISLKGGSHTKTDVLFEGGGEKKDALVFSVNHYLGLHRHIEVITAAQRAIGKFGAGCGTSSTSGGYSELHKNFERAFCEFVEKEAGIVFPTGYTANLGTICALAGRGDRVVLDREIHASIFDGCKLSGAKIEVFAHNDVRDLKRILRREHKGTTLVVLESVYSMGGTDADLSSLIGAAREHDALVMVDESHGFGFYGKRGAGLSEAQNVLADVDIYMTTMSKSLASVGGVIAGDKDLIELIRCTSRALLFQACAPANSIAAAHTALDLIRKGCGRDELWANTRHFRDGVKRLELPTGGTSPIVPIFTKSSYAARQAAQKLLENGIYTPPITYPAVAHDQSRLRFTITAAHRKSELDRALNALDAARPIFAAVEPKKNTLNGFENIFSNGGAQLSTKFGYLEALHSGASSSEESLLTLARTIVSSNGNG